MLTRDKNRQRTYAYGLDWVFWLRRTSLRSHLVDCGQRKDKIQWMYLALVGDRKGIRSLKSSSKSPYLSHRGSTAKGPQSLGYQG